MLQDMANYIKKLTDENEKLKEENEQLKTELSSLYSCMNYWRDKYYTASVGISTRLKVILKDTIEEEDNVL